MIKVDLSELSLQDWLKVYTWCINFLKVENHGATWDYDIDQHILYLSEKSATIFLLKWG